MFSANDTIGIAGATSTPMWLMQEVKAELEKF
jgi:4-hydroxy-3-methylbut-2-enyl diphosphate reductase